MGDCAISKSEIGLCLRLTLREADTLTQTTARTSSDENPAGRGSLRRGLSRNRRSRSKTDGSEWITRPVVGQLTMPGENVLAHTAHLYQPGTRPPYGVLEWPAMLRLLDAEDRNSGYPPYWN